MSELAKAYDPSTVEQQAYQTWLEENAFHADPSDGGEPYTIVIPPPNVTGALHLGHAIDNTLQDILIRRKRMQGYNTLWMPGIDHAGIATQAVVEKELKEKENKTRHDIGREALVERIWAWKEQYGNRILNQLKRLGASCDWDRTRFTLDEMCARAVRETFFKLFKDGLIYRGKRLVNWDTHLQTAVADDEIFHETVKGGFWTLKYPVKDAPGEFIRFSTTRPETMLGDTAVAVHPEDPRYKHLIGRQVTIPLVNRGIPIIADPELVDPTMGTGAVKVTPAHDPNDYAAWQRQGGKIGIINILTPEGQINENGGPYAGLARHIARERVVYEMEKLGLFEGREDREIPLAHSDRSKTPIEPYLSDQWFVKMDSLAQMAIDAVQDGRVKFFPDRYAKTYLDWLGEKRDWCISRQLWWGHRIPVWRHDNAPGDALDWLKLQDQQLVSIAESGSAAYVCLRHSPEDGDTLLIAKRLESWGFIQDPDVLDTWFSSALWPHSTLGWPEQTPELAKYYPTNVLVTGRDIITLWVARMVITGLYNMDKVPFHHVHIHPTILDGKGERMSKSKGNGVDPVEIIETSGADALRFTLAQMATETQDVRMPVKKLPDGRNTSEKFDAGRNFCNKLWNATRFALTNLSEQDSATGGDSDHSLADRWILSRLARTIAACDEALESYHFDQYAKACYDFFWRDLCDWYIEAIKPELKPGAPRRGAVAQVLATALDASLRLMHPVIPFITEVLWWKLNEVCPKRTTLTGSDQPEKRLVRASWPKFDPALLNDAAERDFATLQEVISTIRKVRNDYNVDPRKSVSVSINAPADIAAQLNASRGVIELLATCELKQAAPNLPAPPSAARALAGGCEIFLEDLVDTAAERQRLGKQQEQLTKQIAGLRGRLSNEAYTAKAPPHLVQQTRDQLAAAEAELAKVEQDLARV